MCTQILVNFIGWLLSLILIKEDTYNHKTPNECTLAHKNKLSENKKSKNEISSFVQSGRRLVFPLLRTRSKTTNLTGVFSLFYFFFIHRQRNVRNTERDQRFRETRRSYKQSIKSIESHQSHMNNVIQNISP